MLAGTNTYTGSTTVSAGTVMIPGIVPSHGNTIVGNTATQCRAECFRHPWRH